jgi:alkanesulfonate monooxygenase SsuD/methylene tetrahydromethanopterin reductase-like flavin-dependent oxidoreductase (luciferase family)
MCRVAGEVGDGLHVHPFHSPQYIRDQVQPAVEEGLKTAGKVRADFTFSTSTFVVLGETDLDREPQRRAVKQQIAFYASTPTYEPVLAAHGWQDVAPHLQRRVMAGDWNGMADLITDEMLDTYAVTGTHDTIGARIQERYAGLIDRAAFYEFQPGFLDDPNLPDVVKQFNGT